MNVKGAIVRNPKYPVTLNGETRSVAHWAKQHGLKPDDAYYRIRCGMPPEEALRYLINRRSKCA